MTKSIENIFLESLNYLIYMKIFSNNKRFRVLSTNFNEILFDRKGELIGITRKKTKVQGTAKEDYICEYSR